MEDLIFKIDGESTTPACFEAKARNFKLVIDEPFVSGNENDTVANSLELLLASYAACVNAAAQLSARELGIKVEKIRISVHGDFNPARLLGQSESGRAGFKHIDIDFSPISDATPELMSEWLNQIKRRCPINENIVYPTPVYFNLTFGEDNNAK
jgi:uncharacterized OsmC-like protein